MSNESTTFKTHKDLDVWNKSIELAENIYKLTSSFPKEEQYGLVSQLRRAVISISSNIAEGAARNSKKEFIQFLYIAVGSLSELETQLIISEKLKFVKDVKILNETESIRKMILGLIKYLKKKT